MTTEELNVLIAQAEGGDVSAMNQVAHVYSDNADFKDSEKAFIWYKKSAELGNVNSMSNLGLCYAYGEGSKKNFTLAEKWLKKAAYKHDIRSMKRLSWLYASFKYDWVLSEIWKKRAADAERRKKEEIAQKEEEVRSLLQKDPDDLTGREVKRLKELQSDPDINMEDFLTMKEYKKLLSIIGEPKKEEPSEMSLFGHPIQFIEYEKEQHCKGEEDAAPKKTEEIRERELCELIERDYNNGENQELWSHYKDCQTIVIPEGVSKIGRNAFANCIDLRVITIPDSVIHIGEGAFYGCSDLQSIRIPDAVSHIDSEAFRRCESLTTVRIGNNVKKIGNSVFSDCSSLNSIEISNAVTSIGKSAFLYCTGLTSIEIPNSVTCISEYAFCGCSNLTSIKMGKGVTSIEMYAFHNCACIEQIIVPQGTKPSFEQMEGLEGLEDKIVEE